jgi:tRNA-dihydrouridine synthase B
VAVARIAEDCGVQALAMHGRTRACGFTGRAEYDTIAEVKTRISIPLIANGDINSPEDARRVLEQTGADGVMIGRAAQGRPWIFREIEHYLATGELLPPPLVSEIREVLLAHLEELYAFYGPETGVKIARKHISWYTKGLAGSAGFRHAMNQLQTREAQRAAVEDFFDTLAGAAPRLQYAAVAAACDDARLGEELSA